MQRLFRGQTILLVVALIMSACGPTVTPSPAPTPTARVELTIAPLPSTTTTPGSDQLHTTILTAFRNQQALTYRQRSSTVLKDGTTHQTVVESAPPDRYHILADATTELIVIGSKVYLKDKAGWTQPSIPADSLIDLDFVNRLDRTLSDLQLLEAEPLNGVSMQVYQYRSTLKVGESESIGQSKIWINPADQLPYKLVIEGETAALDNSTGKVTGVPATTTILYEYDPTIQITAPK